jgi:hypothetical protein
MALESFHACQQCNSIWLCVHMVRTVSLTSRGLVPLQKVRIPSSRKVVFMQSIIPEYAVVLLCSLVLILSNGIEAYLEERRYQRLSWLFGVKSWYLHSHNTTHSTKQQGAEDAVFSLRISGPQPFFQQTINGEAHCRIGPLLAKDRPSSSPQRSGAFILDDIHSRGD